VRLAFLVFLPFWPISCLFDHVTFPDVRVVSKDENATEVKHLTKTDHSLCLSIPASIAVFMQRTVTRRTFEQRFFVLKMLEWRVQNRTSWSWQEPGAWSLPRLASIQGAGGTDTFQASRQEEVGGLELDRMPLRKKERWGVINEDCERLREGGWEGFVSSSPELLIRTFYERRSAFVGYAKLLSGWHGLRSSSVRYAPSRFRSASGILWIPKVICERWECIVSESAAGILWILKLICRTRL